MNMQRAGRGAGESNETLDSWKAIAGYLRRDVRTVMRWERHRGLPVHRVPGGGKPTVFALKRELEAWWRKSQVHLVSEEATPAASRPPSVAVLPFTSLSTDKENEYFSDGLADGIITALTRIGGLLVTARTSSFAFRGKSGDVRKIGAALGVATLLEGSVQRSGGRIRVSAQLVQTADGFHVWSENYDRDLADIFAIQDEISGAIARALAVRLAAPPRRTPDLAAYTQWLKGRYYQQYENLEAVAKCRACFEQAIALDPLFPQPYLGLAQLLRAAADFGLVDPGSMAGRMRAGIGKALELDPSLGEAYAASGVFRAWIDFDWEGAEADFKRALELAPANAEVHRMYAMNCLVPTSRLDEAAREVERSIELDPLSPLAHCLLGKVLIWKRDFDGAMAKMDAAVALRPGYAIAVGFRGVALWFQGRIAEGVECLQAAQQQLGASPSSIGAIGNGLALTGRGDEARRLLAGLDTAERARCVSPIARAWIHMGLGETDAAFECHDRAVDRRDPHILDLPCKPLYDPLRSDARFRALLGKMRLA